MKLGLGLPHLGPLASPGAIRSVAMTAEAVGFDSLWAMDRLLAPVTPRTLAYPGSSDGTLPAAQQTVIDPLVALTVAATVTEHVTLGTDVLVAPWYPPVLLGRTLAAIDQVSNGRLVVGLGLGWSIDEFEAVGVLMTRRGQRIEESLDVLSAVWSDDTIDIRTAHERIAPSVMGAKPIQRPRPPILLGAHSDAGLERIARRADGWLPFGLPLDDIEQQWMGIQRLAERSGRDPAALQLVVRADPQVDAKPGGRHRTAFTGSLSEVTTDIERVQEIGATELILDFHTSARTVDDIIDWALCLTQPTRAAA
ncbi:TIGR03619 family F420-dependent LLM class oxidoreductase [Ilumatobacter sp.]|uniref:TIGR03619 family F420-dependent LLM class oxidoreductase n=1 Tax=Ilumatobacter sp. TaxID=1967498 RepID=UPI003C6044D0